MNVSLYFRWSVSLTGSTGPTVWWKVTLDSTYFIDIIKVYNRLDSGPERIDDVTIKIDDELVASVIYVSGQQPYTFPYIQKTGTEVSLWGSTTASSPYLQLAEVEVYGTPVASMWNLILIAIQSLV